MRRQFVRAALVALTIAAGAVPAHAQPVDVPALQKLIEQHAIKASDVAKVRVWNVGVTRIADYDPRGAVDAQFSLPYAVATTLLREPLTPALYAERKIKSAPVRAMMKRIECIEDPQMDFDWFKRNIMRTRVEITLKNGKRVEQAATFPDDKPKYGYQQVVAKLEAMSDGLLPVSRVGQIADTVERLDKLADVTVLARLLVPARRSR